jgi:hypothetical protein
MRLQRYFALSLCLLIAASLGCSSNSGSAQQPQQQTQPAAPVQTAAGQPAPTATGGSAATTTASGTDVCALLTSDEIKSVQGEAVLEAKPNRRTDSPFAVNQCFYMTPSFTKSVSIEVTRQGASEQSVREFWKANFERAEDKREKKNERRKLKGKPLAGEPATPVKGIGDEAYWVSTNANSTLYAFKKDALIRISIGGTDKEEERMKKIKTLAQKALARL